MPDRYESTHRDPEGEGQDKTDSKGDGHHVVKTLGSKHLWTEGTPGDGVSCANQFSEIIEPSTGDNAQLYV